MFSCEITADLQYSKGKGTSNSSVPNAHANIVPAIFGSPVIQTGPILNFLHIVCNLWFSRARSFLRCMNIQLFALPRYNSAGLDLNMQSLTGRSTLIYQQRPPLVIENLLQHIKNDQRNNRFHLITHYTIWKQPTVAKQLFCCWVSSWSSSAVRLPRRMEWTWAKCC